MKKACFFFFFLLAHLTVYSAKKLSIGDKISSDYKEFYSAKTGIFVFSSLLATSFLANTKADQSVNDFYQKKIRSEGSDVFSKVVKPFGDRKMAITLFGSYLILKAFEKVTGPSVFLNFSEKVSRLLLVGTIPLLVTQAALGGSRPDDLHPHSNWKPFQNHKAVSASGHSFFGALPFLAVASLVEPLYLKVLFISLSTLTAFSRINDHKHYLSQAILGWSFAYFSYRALERSDSKLKLLASASFNEIALGLRYVF